MHAELRAAIQQARRHPWYFGGAALSLAIGMSVATAVFGVVDAVLLQPLPFHDPGRLVHVAETVPVVDGRQDRTWIPARHTVEVVAARSFSDVAVIAREGLRSNNEVQVGGTAASAVQGAHVTTNFFRLLGARPVLGRDFTDADGTPGALAVIISHRLWNSQFGGDTATLNRHVDIGGVPHRVIGIMGEGFTLPDAHVWLPLRFATIDSVARSERDNDVPPYIVFARLGPGVSHAAASAELATLYQRNYGETWRSPRSSRAAPLQEHLTGGMEDAFQLWTAIAILIGILCAVNFATISLARGMRRRAEIAVRAAMGASTARLARLLVVEAMLIAAAGGVLSVVFGTWMTFLARRWFGSGGIILNPSLSWTTVAFGLLATVVVGVIFALAPAVELARVDLRSRLQGGTTQATSRKGELRGRRLLVGLQLSLALTAVAAVAALVHSDQRHWAADAGIDHRNLYSAYVEMDTAARLAGPLLDRMRASPGVAEVSMLGRTYGVSAWTDNRADDAFYSWVTDVSPSFFRTIGLPVRVGRIPTEDERAARAPVIVISSQLARQSFGSDSGALGRRLHLRTRRGVTWYTIVGVVPAFGGRALWELASQIYTMQDHVSSRGILVFRRTGDMRSTGGVVAEVAQALGTGVRVSRVVAAQQLVDAERAERMGRMLFVMSIGGLALVLAVIGLYGLAAYNTEARAREFGIRIALGARPARIAASLLDELWSMVAIGIVVALVAAAYVTSFLDNRFRNPLAEQAPMTLPLLPALAAAFALCFVLLIANAVPMRRVLRLDVMRAINSDSAS
jgi:predicted permease